MAREDHIIPSGRLARVHKRLKNVSDCCGSRQTKNLDDEPVAVLTFPLRFCLRNAEEHRGHNWAACVG